MPSPEKDVGNSYTEYGVIVDRTGDGLGYFLAETTRDFERAARLARRSPLAWGYPAEVKARRVYVTDWDTPLPPGSGDTP